MSMYEEHLPGHHRNCFKRSLCLIALTALSLTWPGDVVADEVTDWNQNTINAIQTARASAIATLQILAVEQAAVFEAVNGIERRFSHIYVRPEGPRRASRRSATLVDNARLFALLNLAASDATIVAWDAKYYYNWWRPITAIRLAGADGNDDTDPDAAWSPLQTTPNHQEYVSGHSTVSGAAARVLATILGDDVAFTHESDTLAGVMRAHTNFSAAADEANESRIFTGAHFRSSCNDGKEAGDSLGNFIVSRIARPNRN